MLKAAVNPAEAAQLRALDERDAGTRRRLLLLLCGVCRGHPALGRLGRGPLTQVVLHLGEQEADWAEEALAEHFLQALELLVGSLERASLPCHFSRGVNLLDGLREEDIDDMGCALYTGACRPPRGCSRGAGPGGRLPPGRREHPALAFTPNGSARAWAARTRTHPSASGPIPGPRPAVATVSPGQG